MRSILKFINGPKAIYLLSLVGSAALVSACAWPGASPTHRAGQADVSSGILTRGGGFAGSISASGCCASGIPGRIPVSVGGGR